jgi:hypothetical protein
MFGSPSKWGRSTAANYRSRTGASRKRERTPLRPRRVSPPRRPSPPRPSPRTLNSFNKAPRTRETFNKYALAWFGKNYTAKNKLNKLMTKNFHPDKRRNKVPEATRLLALWSHLYHAM